MDNQLNRDNQITTEASTTNTDGNIAFPFVLKAEEVQADLNDWIMGNRSDFEGILYKHGAILFRGFNINTVAKFEKISDLFDLDSLEYGFRSSPRFAVGKNVYTSTSYPKEFSINMHSEGSYVPSGHPRYIVFCCIHPAAKKGETPIADNRKVLRYLSEPTRAKFLEKGVRYLRNLNKETGLSWQEVFQTQNKDEVKAECEKTGIEFHWKGEDNLELVWTKKAIWEHPKTGEPVWFNHASFFNKYTIEKDYGAIEHEDQLPNNTLFGDGTEISRAEVNEVIDAYKQATTEFLWRRGDVLFLDNMLSAHGRNPYEGKRKIITSMF